VSYASKNVGEWVDLTRDLAQDIPKWPTVKGLNYTEDFAGQTPLDTYYAYKCFCMGEHIGTHIDAPRHFGQKGQTVNEIPLEHLMGVRKRKKIIK
jgi:kynurenine formamidase